MQTELLIKIKASYFLICARIKRTRDTKEADNRGKPAKETAKSNIMPKSYLAKTTEDHSNKLRTASRIKILIGLT